jgi:hypothetical protein
MSGLAARARAELSFWRAFVGLLRLGRSGSADRMGPAVFGEQLLSVVPVVAVCGFLA